MKTTMSSSSSSRGPTGGSSRGGHPPAVASGEGVKQWGDHGIAKNIEVVFNDVHLQLHVDMNIGIGGDKWPAADLFCNLVASDRWRSFFGELFDRKSIVELGSGNGTEFEWLAAEVIDASVCCRNGWNINLEVISIFSRCNH
jgi:hypothetical protein